MTEALVMELADGRKLGWLDLGDPGGPPVIVLHGTPGSCLQVSAEREAIGATGVRFIAPDRPGYGHSAFVPKRRLADWALDVEALADHLGIERFSVVGYSGGGPHALACARYLADRVVSAGVVSGVGLLQEPRSEAGMMGFNQVVTHLARRSQLLAYPAFAISTWVCRRWPERVLESFTRQLPAADIKALARPQIRSAFMDEYRQTSWRTALSAAQDFALFAHDWGFRLEEIATPVHLWQGDQDRNVPEAHGRVLAERVPGAQLHECPGEGHMVFFDHIEEILRTVCPAP